MIASLNFSLSLTFRQSYAAYLTEMTCFVCGVPRRQIKSAFSSYIPFFIVLPISLIHFDYSEAYIAVAVLRLIEEEKCVVEGAGATGLAAALSGQLDHLKGKR